MIELAGTIIGAIVIVSIAWTALVLLLGCIPNR